MKKIILFICLFFLFSCFPKEIYKTPKIIWESCKNEKYLHWFFDEIDEKLLCSEFEVPLDYEKKFGEKIILSLTKYPAISEKPIGDLLLIAGGPGDSSLKAFSENLLQDENSKKIFENFNIIGYSPRGVFPSNPQIDCGIVGDESSEKIIEKCIENTGKNFLKNVSSLEAFEDVEQIRLGLGGEKISVISYSYGTKILALYTEKYGENLRAGVFDGVVDLNEDVFSMLENQEKGFQKSFDNFVKFCLDFEECIFYDKNLNYNSIFHKFLNNLDEKKMKDKNGGI